MGRTNDIKEALKKGLRGIDGVEHCWIEQEGEEIFHVYAVTRTADYVLQKRVFEKYADIEDRFPEARFEFRTTSLSKPQEAEAVF